MEKTRIDNQMEIEMWKEEYIKTLSEKEKKSYLIAKTHLGMSFQLEKSVGFREWYKEQIRQSSQTAS